ncbi:unnamed protein product, partial [Polarella glacialis]
ARLFHLSLPARQVRGWWGGLRAPGGLICCPPDGAGVILVVEPLAGPRPHVSAIPCPAGSQGSDSRWTRGAMGPDGRLYCGAFDGTTALIVDPEERRAWEVGDLPLGRGKWSDPAAAGDGRLYCAPFCANSVLTMDPSSEAAFCFDDLGTITGAAAGGNAGALWTRGVLGVDGRLYCAPLSAPAVLVIDPAGPSTKALGSLGNDQGKWNEGVAGLDGCIYCSPDGETSVLKINPLTEVVERLGQLPEGRRKWTKGVLAPNGRIFCAPLCAETVLVINPARSEVVELCIPTPSGDGSKPKPMGPGRFKWTAGVVGPDGNIYCAPLCAPNVLVIDPRAGACSVLGELGDGKFKWNEGSLGLDGRIYCSPAMSRESGLLVIEPTGGFAWTRERHRYFPPGFKRVVLLLLLIRRRGRQVLIGRIIPCLHRYWFDIEETAIVSGAPNAL